MSGNQGQGPAPFGRGNTNGNRRGEGNDGNRRGEGNDGENNHRPRNNRRNRRSQTNGQSDQSQESNNGQNHHQQRQQGNRRGSGNYANHNPYSDHQQNSNGQGRRNCHRRDHSAESSNRESEQKQHGSSTEQKKRFEGPVFGFTRLFNFLSADANEVISNMSRNLKEWEILLEQDSIATMKTLRNGQTEMSDDSLVLIVTLLGEKVLSHTIVLESKQIALISSSASCRNFLSKIDSKCKAYMMQDGDVLCNRRRKIGNEMDVDQSRLRWFRNLYKIFHFIATKMKFTALDFLGKLIPTTLGALAYLSQADGDGVCKKLLEDFQQLKKLMDDIKKEMENKSKGEEKKRRRKYDLTPEEEQMLHEMQPPDDYKDCSIIPSIAELKSDEQTFLRTNKTSGAYIDANHYLDVQFRLLREDFVRPLKIGIQDYMKNKIEYLTKKKRPPIGNVRIYNEVRLTKSDMVKGTMVQYVQLHPTSYSRVKWDKSKRLLVGSLLVLTSDDFDSAHFATVHSRDENDLKQGIFGIVWEGLVPDFSTKEEVLYLLVESENYFEAYKHTLKILKEIDLENFPMAKFIVDASSDVRAPRYLLQNRHLLNIGKPGVPPFSPLQDRNWPSCGQLKLDERQYEAFKACLTREFAIVQGPPGTGKTFLALQIVEVLLRNPSIWSHDDDEGGVGPILVVCYTNHALDSFLEGILKVFQKIDVKPSMTRVGGRSKTEALDEFSLMRQRNVAAKFRQFDPSYARMKREAHEAVKTAENERVNLMTELFALNNLEGVVDLNSLSCSEELQTEIPSALLEEFRNPEWFGFGADFQQAKINDNERLKRWFNVQKTQLRAAAAAAKPTQVAAKRIVEDSDSDEDYDLDELQENRLIDDIFMEAERADNRVLPNIGKNLKYLHNDVRRTIHDTMASLQSQIANIKASKALTAQAFNADRMKQLQAEFQIQKGLLNAVEKRESFMQLVLTSYKDKSILLPDMSKFFEAYRQSHRFDVPLNRQQKWATFFFCVERAKLLTAVEIKRVNDELFNAQKQLQEVFRYGDGQIIKKAQILGMTTTGAAKYNDLLRMARSRIVIVEEAAEVLESHIVTCLTPACQHLILIGDHQQLRPSTTVYELSTQYKLDISLFERMVNNQLNCYKINVQHRMRPEIANLVVDTIYPELYNAPSVHNYPPVAGVLNNLFFITHNEAESSESDTKSKSNEHEAKFVAALTRYLVQQGYGPERITVLTTYLGQMFLIKQKMREYKTCQGVRVTCVDNFQGEENDIIILSLVRSNEDGNIGFLKTDNRICVAVSRAKHGLFIIGNMSKLAAKSETWKKVQTKLSNRNEIGTSLTIECQVHGTIADVSTDQQFQNYAPEGGCTNLCGVKLTSCSHECAKVCHKDDPQHQKYNCQKPCEKSCPKGHPCKAKCFKSCPPCPVLVTKTLPCRHTPTLMCHIREESVTCYELVERTLPCTHKETMACFVDYTKYVCKVKVFKDLKCGIHRKEMECNKDPRDVACKVVVEKTLPCKHKQNDCCWIKEKDILCETEVTVTHKKCNHKEQMKCHSSKRSDIKCRSRCTTRLLCGHNCTLICHPDEDPDHLHYICKKDCGRICATGDNSSQTDEHRCLIKHPCHTPCPPCKKMVNRKLRCNHDVEMRCHESVDATPCVMPCSETLVCRHKCKGLCFERCPPCEEPVMKRSSDCGHSQMMPCSKIYFQSQCEFKVNPANAVSICGHSFKVPCKISRTISATDMLPYCEQLCEFLFQSDNGGCGHTCKGSCSECLHGRLHVKCQEECGKTLICGHRCNFPCSSSCPPCQQKCIFSCEHSNCEANCGEPCVQCTEPCIWRCEHKACTKLCSDLCDREPCDEPCKLKLECGHDCIGYCGEKCPTQCRDCDRTELTEFVLYGNEDDENARFILLEDCGHAIEHEGLDYYMTNDIEEGEITAKNCPRCRTLISRSRRYGNVIKKRLKDVLEIKAKKFGMTKETEKIQLVLMQKLRLNEMMSFHFPDFTAFLLGILCKEVADRNGKMRTRTNMVDATTLMTLEIIIKYLQDAVKQSMNSKNEPVYLKAELNNDLFKRFNKLFDIMMCRKMPLSVTELEDFDGEFHRLHDLKQIYLQVSSLSYNIRQHATGSTIFVNLMEIIDSPCRKYDSQSKNAVKILLKQLEQVLSTGLGISDRERLEILAAFNMREGRWFKCPNGHYYVITECGGAMIESKCNECGATIGGGSHRLRSDNQFGGDFDGASQPLWPQ